MRKIYTFSTSKYDEEAKKHSETDVIEKFRNDNKEHTGRMEITPYSDSEYKYIEKTGGKGGTTLRHIFTCKIFSIENVDAWIYVFLRVIPRDGEYKKIFNTKCTRDERAKKTGISDLNWEYYYENVKKRLQNKPVVKLKSELSDDEKWFTKIKNEESEESLNAGLSYFPIFEMREWVECVSPESGFNLYEETRAKIEEYCSEHLDDNDSKVFEIPIERYDGKKIVGYQENRKEKEDVKHERYDKGKGDLAFYLFSIIESDVEVRYISEKMEKWDNDRQKAYNFSINVSPKVEVYCSEYRSKVYEHCHKIANDYTAQVEIPIDDKKITGYYENYEFFLVDIDDKTTKAYYIPSIDTVIPLRGYSAFFLLENKDWWREIEENKKTNFVLSESELRLVSTSNDREYPIFICGSAGSGKTTVLQYLFAETIIYYLKYKNNCPHHPVYISYNKELIKGHDGAIEFSKKLFEGTEAYIGAIKKNHINYKTDIKEQYDKLYCVFGTIAKKCIEGKIAEKRFDDNLRITFVKFHQRWMEKFGKISDENKVKNAIKKYGPSLSWHIIRTYIKGWDKSGYMTPEDYDRIGSKNQTVTRETFELVYNKIWLGWYKDITNKDGNKCWDDQDLIRYCLAPDDDSADTYVKEKYSAIYCDEAQDFTRVEIDFILKLSLFSNRSIPNIDTVKQMPFVFAGDEFQTLNPTGFSWRLLRSYFTERLFESVGLNPKIEDSKTSEAEPLSQNFRSTSSIVKFANHIQLLRAARLEQDTKPQEAYFSIKGAPVYCLPINDNVINKLRETETVLIIPAAEGETVYDFIAGTELEGKLNFTKDNILDDKLKVYSPSQAKGLAYKNVALFGFKCNDKLNAIELKQWFVYNSSVEDSDIELKYQLSNAYVAATRAENKLYILDDFNNINSFWSFAFANKNKTIEELNELMLQKAGEKYWSEDKIGYITGGHIEDITEENKRNYDEYRKNEIEKALKSFDIDFIQQIAIRYKGTYPYKYYQMMARIEELKGNYDEVAKYYVKADMIDDAIEIYWSQLAENRDINIVKKITECGESTSRRINRILKWSKKCFDKNNTLLVLLELIEEVNDANEDLSSWVNIISIILDSINDNSITQKQTKELKIVLEKINEFDKRGITIKIFYPKLAKLFYIAEEYNQAIVLWEKTNSTKPQEYYYAKIATTNYPQRLEFYEKADYKKDKRTWQTAVYQEFINNKTAIEDLDEKYRKIIYKAISDQKLFGKYIANMLADVSSDDEYRMICNKLTANNIEINKQVIDVLFFAKQNRMNSIQKFTTKNRYLKIFFDIMDYLKECRTDDYYKKFDGELASCINPNAKESFFDKRFTKDFKELSPIHFLVLFELGKHLEERGILVDSLVYYEWMQKNVTLIEKYAVERWIICKEKQSEREDSERLYEDALFKRRDYDLLGAKIDDAPSIPYKIWVKIFERALKIKAYSVEEPSKPMEQKIEDTKLENDTNTILKEKAKALKSAGVDMNIIMSTFNLTQEEYDNL